VPFVVGLGYYGSKHIDRMRAGIAHAQHYALLAAALGVLVFLTVRHLRKLRAASAGS
jgi:hypothetical protein